MSAGGGYIEVIAYTSLGGGNFRAFEVESDYTPTYFVNNVDIKYFIKNLRLPGDMVFDNIYIHKAGNDMPNFGLDEDSVVIKMISTKDEVVHIIVKRVYNRVCT